MVEERREEEWRRGLARLNCNVMRFTQWVSHCRKQFPDLSHMPLSMCCVMSVEPVMEMFRMLNSCSLSEQRLSHSLI